MAEESMLPPPGRPQTNADFRKLLETPRIDRGDDAPRERRPRKQNDAPKPKKKSSRPKPEPEKPADDGYRDRAEERRKGFNPDYERVSADLANLVSGQGGARVADLADNNSLTAEERSKYLGGDMDHTHLVKGLDYALLQRVRGEMGKDESAQTADGKPGKIRAAVKEPEVIKFKGPTGRAVYNALFSRSRVDSAQLFMQGRTAFVYDLESPHSSDLPTTLRRSKADCPEVVEKISGGMDKSVLERMVKIMSYMRGTGSKPGKLKKKEKLRIQQMMDGLEGNGTAKPRPSGDAEPPRPVDEDEDIFGDAGRDYQPELPQSANGRASDDHDEGEIPPPPPPLAPVGPARPSGGYDAAAAAYAAYGDEDDAPPPPPPLPPAAPPPAYQDDAEDMELDQLAGLAPQPPPPATEAEAAGVAKAMRRKGEAAADEAIPRDTEDAYEECFPGYGGFSGAVVDSDEEDLTHMDGVKEAGRSRKDFETQEQWEAYKSNKEMNPKAAFQFGVKTKDGRKGQGKLGGGKAVEQKEQQQLRKIQGIFDEKHGDKYSKAFTEAPEPAAEGGGAGYKPAPKRRRI